MADGLEVRCPWTHGLFFKVLDDGKLAIGCDKCRTRARKEGRNVALVLHIYDPDTFDLVDTEHLEPVPPRVG